MSTSSQQIADLIQTNTELKQYYENNRDDIEARVAAKEARVDQFLQEASPEPRIVQDITIGGSADLLYPVAWSFYGNGHGVNKLTIARSFNWNPAEIALNPDGDHQAGLLIEIEGGGNAWSGDAQYLSVKRYNKTYNATASHLQYSMKATRRKIDNSIDNEYEGYATSSPRNSGLYLRGGGLGYRFISNWPISLILLDEGESEKILTSHPSSNTEWVITPIPFSDLQEPIED